MTLSSPLVRIGDVADVNPSDREWSKAPDETMVTFVPMPAVSAKNGSIESATLRPMREVRKGFTRFREGDVLIAKISPSMENGKIARAEHLSNGLGAGTTEFHVLRPTACVLGDYLYHALKRDEFRTAAARSLVGVVGQKRVPKEFLSDYEIPLPPIREQERIAALLDELDALQRLREQAADKSAAVLPALFAHAFSDQRVEDEGWQTRAFGEIAKVTNGNFLPAKSMQQNGAYLVYGGNGVTGRHDAFMFAESVIAIGRVGQACGAVHVTEPNSWVTDNALFVSSHDESVDPGYLADALRAANLRQYAAHADLPSLSGARLAPVPIVIPPLDIQRRYVATRKMLANIIDAQSTTVTQLSRAVIAARSRLFG